jgi:hypothetical protein
MENNSSNSDADSDVNYPRLTFGVEIEFCIASVLQEMTGKDGEEPDPSDPHSIFGLTEGIHLGKDAFNVREHAAKTL